MHPCFWDIRPPRAADGPVPPRLWRRLAFSVSALLMLLVAMQLLARS
jgi:hypothetical protein